MDTVAKKPKYVWIVHNNCAKKCVHCFCNPSPMDDFAETEKLVEDLHQENIDAFVYATNQMDKRLAGLYSQINRNALIASSYTDQALLDLRPDIKNIAFSLHGPRPEVHAVLATAADFQATLANLRKTRENKNLNIVVYCVVHSKNYALLEEMCQFCYDEGVAHIDFLKLSYSGRAITLPKDLFLSQEQLTDFLKRYHRIKSKFKGMKLNLISNWGPQYSKLKILYFKLLGSFFSRYACQCGVDHVAIQSGTREIYPCRYTVTVPELKMGHFDSEKGFVFTNNWFLDLEEKIGEPCKSCTIYRNCQGGCRADAFAEKKRLTGDADIYAGFTNCAVSMGITRWIDQEDYAAVKKRLRKIFTI